MLSIYVTYKETIDQSSVAVFLSVAVVEFGIHMPRYWSETFHGVSIEC